MLEFMAESVVFVTVWALALSGALRLIDRWASVAEERENKRRRGD